MIKKFKSIFERCRKNNDFLKGDLNDIDIEALENEFLNEKN